MNGVNEMLFSKKNGVDVDLINKSTGTDALTRKLLEMSNPGIDYLEQLKPIIIENAEVITDKFYNKILWLIV
ncbi:ABC-type thiamine transport system substrate-binding protein [Pectinatus brassicae]|uniref:ABC-type thiamine transport system substrate-binding protein n=2 Tax=Pectinatus brassicae TaxID=862415 RepID=A0A840UPW9_9FIRM|nr:hypothetical protein [Pectinatus brassicae]MBB5336242.1 ABC-type thiamine transport system substrate-binding protein [Pectinatus brassicae]